jgi:antitoxin (DNA-binding transcriptional repressor) of toxin-antitoxin stability system
MITTISIEEAQASLPEIVKGLSDGSEVVITVNDQPVAELRRRKLGKQTPQFGNCAGMLAIVQEDDEHLQDFQEYMP